MERHGSRGIVVILAMTDENKVLLVEQYRRPVNKNVIEYPAGLMGDHPGCRRETAVSAAKRELLEETGYRARRIAPVTEGPSASGSSAVILTFVRALDIQKIHEGGGDPTESIIVHEVALKDVPHWITQKRRQGCLVDPKIYAGLYFLNIYNCIEFTPNPHKNRRSSSHGKSHRRTGKRG